MTQKHKFLTREAIDLLLQDLNTESVPDVTLDQLLQKSDFFSFTIKFPVASARCVELQETVQKEILENNINSTYPLIHEDVLALCAQFILEKRKNGSSIEKGCYANISLEKLIQRFLRKRAVIFVGTCDFYKLFTSPSTQGYGGWETVGTDKESNLKLEQCLSYDEMKLSAFLSVSSHTHFVNSGRRNNVGRIEENRENIEDNGVVVGLIGPRFAKKGFMEHRDIIFSKFNLWSIPKLMAEFYEVPTNGFMRVMRSDDTTCLEDGSYFDNETYKKRLQYSFDTALIEANHRGKMKNCYAYLHMVGIGLGVWKISHHQDQVFLDKFAERIEKLGPNLHNLSDVRFGYFSSETCGKYKNGDKVPLEGHPNGGISVHFSKDDPHLKLRGDDEGKLLVVTFAWDSNSLPGNEYWENSLHTSSDPAAACSTQVAELHNAHINPKCSGANLRVATRDCQIISYQEYLEKIK